MKKEVRGYENRIALFNSVVSSTWVSENGLSSFLGAALVEKAEQKLSKS